MIVQWARKQRWAGLEQVFWTQKSKVWASKWEGDCGLGLLEVGRWNWDPHIKLEPSKGWIIAEILYRTKISSLVRGDKKTWLSWQELKVEKKVLTENLGRQPSLHVNLGLEFTLYMVREPHSWTMMIKISTMTKHTWIYDPPELRYKSPKNSR